jgi:hypothetical protein
MSDQSAGEPPLGAPNGGLLLRHLSWPILLLLTIILTVCAGLVALAFISPGSNPVAEALAQSNGIARVVALIIIVPAICVLALLDKINGAAAIAALSAIAGYVLGGTAPK